MSKAQFAYLGVRMSGGSRICAPFQGKDFLVGWARGGALRVTCSLVTLFYAVGVMSSVPARFMSLGNLREACIITHCVLVAS